MKVGVVGASGYAGVELLRLCAGHPDLEVVVATAGGHRGQTVADHTPSLAAAYPDAHLRSATEPSELDGLDLVFLALPHGQSQQLVPGPDPPGGDGGGPGRRLPAVRSLALPDLVRRAPRGAGAAGPVRLRAARAAPRRAARGPSDRRPRLLSHRGPAGPGSVGPGRGAGRARRRDARRPRPATRSRPHRGRGQRGVRGRPGPQGQPPLRRGGRGLRGLRAARPPPHRRDGAGPRCPGPVHPAPGPDGPGDPGHLLRATGRTGPDGHPAALTTTDAMDILHQAYDDEPFVVVTDGSPSTKATSGSNCAHVTVRVDPRTGWVVALCRPRQPGQGRRRARRSSAPTWPSVCPRPPACRWSGCTREHHHAEGVRGRRTGLGHQGQRGHRPGPVGHRRRASRAHRRHLHHQPGRRPARPGQPGPSGRQRRIGLGRGGQQRERQRRHRSPGPGRCRADVLPGGLGPRRWAPSRSWSAPPA